MLQLGSTRFVCLRRIVTVRYLCCSGILLEFVDDFGSVYNAISGIEVEYGDEDAE